MQKVREAGMYSLAAMFGRVCDLEWSVDSNSFQSEVARNPAPARYCKGKGIGTAGRVRGKYLNGVETCLNGIVRNGFAVLGKVGPTLHQHEYLAP
jgi:hypothetical protein